MTNLFSTKLVFRNKNTKNMCPGICVLFCAQNEPSSGHQKSQETQLKLNFHSNLRITLYSCIKSHRYAATKPQSHDSYASLAAI